MTLDTSTTASSASSPNVLLLWDADPFTFGLCVLGAIAYGVALRGRLHARAGFFVAAIVIAVVALASPIGVLSRGYLFSAHMLQHLLLILVVPPLVLLALPAEAALRKAAAAKAPTTTTTRTSSLQTVGTWLLGVSAMWLWHAPKLCDAASQSLSVQRLQTLSLLLMGTAFWWPIFAPKATRRLMPFAAMLYLFTACVACTVLGILVTFSPVQVCSVYAHPVDHLGVLPLLREGWGLTPKADQEIGGLMMWVPACVVYALGILGMLARYYRQEDADDDDAAAALPEGAAPDAPQIAKEATP